MAQAESGHRVVTRRSRRHNGIIAPDGRRRRVRAAAGERDTFGAGDWGRRPLDLDEIEIMIVARKTAEPAARAL